MKNKVFIAIIAILIVAGLSVHLLSKTRPKVEDSPKVPFSIRVENDSVYVDDATWVSSQLVLPLASREPKSDYNYSDDGEKARQARLKNPHRVKVRFSEPINGYLVQVTLHPEEGNDEVGMAEWSFSKDGHTIKIDIGFCWKWDWDVWFQYMTEPKYIGETYELAPTTEMVQGQNSVFIDSPFCFKDVDFDGEYELCFRGIGWNRHYFNIYKILSPSSAEIMTGRPYNNIVYSEVSAGSTVFNYQDKTIHIYETSGSGYYEHLYGLRDDIQDVLNPMKHIRGKECYYASGSTEDYFENGNWIKSIRVYQLDDSDYELAADYVAIDERVFSLQSLSTYKWDKKEEKVILYSQEK